MQLTKIFIFMFRLILLCQIISLYSCVTSRNINHFATKRKLTIKEVKNISLFNGKIEIEEKSKEESKEFVYLLYDKDTLLFVSNTIRIDNNEFIYKLSRRTDSEIILTRATMFPRYYTVDTLLFNNDFAIEKKCLYDNKRVVQFFFTEYVFSNDTLKITSYQYDKDVISISLYKNDLKTIRERIGRPNEVKSYPNQEKNAFFKQYIN